MKLRINGIDVDLTDKEISQLEEGKIPDKIKQLGKLEMAKVYKSDGSYEEKECLVYKFE